MMMKSKLNNLNVMMIKREQNEFVFYPHLAQFSNKLD